MTGRAEVREFLRSGTSMAISISIANVATYGFTLLAARLLGPHEYGAVAALMAAILVVGVLQLGLQATAARRISAEPEHRRARSSTKSSWRRLRRAALGLGLILLALSPLVERLLRLDSMVTAIWLAVAAVPADPDGRRRPGSSRASGAGRPLALVYLAIGIPRLALGGAFIAWRPDQTAAMLGVALGAVCPVGGRLVGPAVAASGSFPRRRTRRAAPPHRDILGEIVHNSQALLAFFALSNADILVARHALDAHDGGPLRRRPDPDQGGAVPAAVRRRGGLPVDVHRVADAARPCVEACCSSAVLGAVGVTVAYFFQRLALVFVGGLRTPSVRPALAVRPARHDAVDAPAAGVRRAGAQGRRPVLLVWSAFVVVLVVGLTTSGVTSLLALVLAVDTALLFVLLLTDVRRLSTAETDERRVAGRGLTVRPDRRGVTASVGGLVPAAAGADRDVERHGEVGGRRPSRARTSASSASRSPGATSNTSSSCTWSSIREREPGLARSRASTWSIATLIRSAAEPWIGALSAIRSAISRRWRLSLVRSGR